MDSLESACLGLLVNPNPTSIIHMMWRSFKRWSESRDNHIILFIDWMRGVSYLHNSYKEFEFQLLFSCCSQGATLFQTSQWLWLPNIGLSFSQRKQGQINVRPGKYVTPYFIRLPSHFTQRASLRITIYVISRTINWTDYIFSQFMKFLPQLNTIKSCLRTRYVTPIYT